MEFEHSPNEESISWTCAKCTFVNEPQSLSCVMCTSARPADTAARWEWRDDARQWHRYPDATCVDLELNGTAVYRAPNGVQYQLNAVTSIQTNSQTGLARRIRRVCPPEPCKRCTFANPPGAIHCEMCGHPCVNGEVEAEQPPLVRLSGETSSKTSERAHNLSTLLRSSLVSLRSSNYNVQTLGDTLNQLYSYSNHPPLGQHDSRHSNHCVVCYTDFDTSKCPVDLPITCGGTSMICRECLTQYIESRVAEGDVMPWIPTPAENNATSLPVSVLQDICSDELLCNYCVEHCSRLLAREARWMKCAGPECRFGFVIEGEKDERECEMCGLYQTVSGSVLDTDKQLQSLVANGSVRMCPVCNDPTMKDYGVCNIIQCANCAVWWNWHTGQHGNSSYELKERARRAGNLWEPGELEYQQRLEQTNPVEFKKLLKKNGIEYDPNYKRGGW